MHIQHFLYLICLILISCEASTSSDDETSSNLEENSATTMPDQESLRPISTSSENINVSFDEMPLLATYINELPFFEGCNYGELMLQEAAPKRLVFNNNKLEYPEGGGDYSSYNRLTAFKETTASFEGGWEGTGGSQAWTCTYQLLSANPSNPMVLVAGQSLEEMRDFEARIEEENNLIEQLSGQGAIGNVNKIARNMLDRDYINRRSLKNGFEDHTLSFWVWQKKDGKWENITLSLFDERMYQQLHEHFPFFSKSTSNKAYKQEGFYLEEDFYTEEALLINKSNWSAWFGVKQLEDITFDLKTEENDILFECSKNKTIRWEWNGKAYHLKNLPKKTPWLNNPCADIDFSANNEHNFRGKIGTYKIEMTVRLNEEKISGEYWYNNKTSSKFPVEGIFHPKADQKLTFYRIKKGKQKESFVCYFIDCQLKGWWQHEGTKQIEKFELTLVS